MSDCECKPILNIVPKCDPVLNIEPNCPVVLDVNTSDRGPAGKDATINGVNALTIETAGTVAGEMSGNVFTITTTTFVFEQGIASSEWQIQHNLGKYPSVVVVDSANSVVIPDVEYIDENNCIVRMVGEMTGKAYLN